MCSSEDPVGSNNASTTREATTCSVECDLPWPFPKPSHILAMGDPMDIKSWS